MLIIVVSSTFFVFHAMRAAVNAAHKYGFDPESDNSLSGINTIGAQIAVKTAGLE
jgi:hypothetical protein